jgi:hypothetical protein
MKKFQMFLILTTTVVAFCAGSLLAQQSPGGNGVPVHIVVTAESHHGENPAVINQQDVMVFEGKERDTVTNWEPTQPDQSPLELFILLDDGSGASLGSQLADIRQFIAEQPAAVKIGIAYMQNGIGRIQQNLTTDHDQAEKALRLPLGNPGVNASPYISLSDLIKRWPESNARREVFMVTDGVDRLYGAGDFQDPYLQSSISDAQRAGVIVFGVYTPGVGHLGHSYWLNYWGQLYLSQLAEETGGEAYYIGFTGAPVSFSPYLDDLGHRLKHQYLLTILAKPQRKAGFQRVRVTTEVPGVDLVAPKSVYVPASQ